MDAITVFGACTVGASVIGYILFKNGRQTRHTTNTHNMYDLDSTEEQDTITLDYAFTKTHKKPDQLLIKLIDQAKENIDLAVYTFTDKGILQRIIQATNRGVKVRLITDQRQSVNAYGQDDILKQLMYAGVPVKENNHNGFMHLKIAIVDSSVVSVGSYNFTKAAKEKHDEIIVVINNKKLASEWTKHFDTMWNNISNYRSRGKVVPKVS
ncbi:phospholipase D-like domain-containing protein [Fredinandcohnia salidurans]|uniref:phospholipase D n=1 Tax=Fredinandcohnia salidurans TaxID=2595041 RepID=A0ABW4MS56_9BACI